jgi:hypothetical protein
MAASVPKPQRLQEAKGQFAYTKAKPVTAERLESWNRGALSGMRAPGEERGR